MPIKLKLNLSSAQLASLSSSTPTSVDKGKAKATPTSSTPAEDAQNEYHSPSESSVWDSPAPIAGPSRLPESSLGPAFSPYTPTTAKPTPPSKSTPKPKARSKVKTKFSRVTKHKAQPRAIQSAQTRPSAIPSHVYSGPSTPLSSPGQMAPPPMPHYPFPSTTTPSPAPESRYSSGLNSPGNWDGDISVKEEEVDMDDEGDDQMSPDPIPMPMTPGEGEAGTPNTRGRGVRWARTKKPLKEILGKIMIELRKRDDYALFTDPVNLEELPNYTTVIGGVDKMMDLTTMQDKIDNGTYRTIDQLEADLNLLVTAAQKFNAPGTIPYRSASNILTHGIRQIERARPLVMTPSPSPTRDPTATPSRFQSVDNVDSESAIDNSESKIPEIDIPPLHRIPVEMLDHPPNSLVGLAVGWSINGGKRVYIKRELRTREKFSGKWRHFDYDGTRSLSEMDDIQDILSPSPAKKPRMVVDWRGMRMRESWWDFPGVGGVYGQPPVPFTKNPVKPAVKTRELGAMEWGNYPEIQMERMIIAQRRSMSGGDIEDEDVLSEHLRPTVAKPKPIKGKKEGPSGSSYGYANTYEDRAPGEWLRDMTDGDVRGEAYTSSVRRFLQCAIKGSSTDVKRDSEDSTGLQEMEKYILEKYNNGILKSETERISQNTLLSLQQLSSSPPKTSTPLLPLPQIKSIAESSHARSTLRYLLRPTNPLDIAPFIHTPGEFTMVGKYPGIEAGLGWVGGELERMIMTKANGKKRKLSISIKEEDSSEKKKLRSGDIPNKVRATSSPLSTAPSSPPQTTDQKPIIRPKKREEDERMKALRLEILALCKFFPLTGLKPLPKALAERVLPPNVRNLLSSSE